MDFISQVKLNRMFAKRRKEIYKDWLRVHSYTKIARKYRLSAARIGQIIAHEQDHAHDL